jgi:retinol dehydrogenase-12/retinol dehydrogenase-13
MGLAVLGADLTLACRNLELGKRTVDQISSLTGAQSITARRIDTSSQRSIRVFVREFLDTHSRLDVLVNNAGIMPGRQPRRESVDGVEIVFATNVLGYFVLTQELLDLLNSSAPARIVNVASAYASQSDLDDLQFKRRPFDSTKAYTESKACDRMLTWAFDRRLEGTGVTANAMTPGYVADTELFRSTRTSSGMRSSGGRTPAQGADTAVWLASSPECEGVTGNFYEDRTITQCEFRNREREDKLWSICERLVGEG